MHKGIKRAFFIASFAALSTVPAPTASAQVHADLGPLHIRIVGDAPPPVRYERRPARPNRNDVWIGGYWDRRDDRWEWTSGRWEGRREGRYNWVKARYVREGRSWRYEPGHWSNERLNDEEYRRWRNDNNNGRRR